MNVFKYIMSVNSLSAYLDYLETKDLHFIKIFLYFISK